MSDLWTAWIAAHRARIASLHVLTPSKLFGLVVGIANARSRTTDLLKVYSDPERYQAALGR